ncbi:Wzz/FepE/Etk N-terminal domain-containing protein [uncultured Propionibacterium sp.]|uniref:Wzz/FepE/Etk N-terminal domain-containing protein n=1 Tax=uncultured Propionibacterium sp. TaxID=218066 RepID=UPI002931EE48|nr:Wzz/FepE/Etk N-terminal domain-containing protein [uncultured Propionibacterium sp.]
MKTSTIRQAVRAHWVVVLVVAIVGLSGGAGRAVLSAPSYSSTASVLIGAADPDEGVEQTYQSSVSTVISDSMSTYSSLATSGVVLNEVGSRLGLNQSATELTDRISATVPLSTSIIEVTATGGDAGSAVELANTTIDVLGDEIIASGMKQSSGSPALKAVIIQDGADRVVETGPSPLTNGIAGLLAGLLVGVLIALAIESVLRRGRDGTRVPLRRRSSGDQEVVKLS